MAMVGNNLGAAIKASIISKKGAPQNDQELTDFCNAIGEAIVSYLISNAIVNVTGADPQGGQVSSTGGIS